jgi:hypothetical protein
VIEAEAWVAHEAALAGRPDAFTPELRRMLEYGRETQAGRLGLQLVAARFRDRALLDTARAFEAARPVPPMPEPGRSGHRPFAARACLHGGRWAIDNPGAARARPVRPGSVTLPGLRA